MGGGSEEWGWAEVMYVNFRMVEATLTVKIFNSIQGECPNSNDVKFIKRMSEFVTRMFKGSSFQHTIP